MKTNKFLTLILSFVAIIAMTSCVEDDDYTVPSSLGAEENAALQTLLNSNATISTIAQVKSLYVTEGDPQEIVSDIYVKGYVTSSDAAGSFFKEFYMQDSPSNPTAAIKIVLDQVDSYNQFNIGREVYINLKGLYVGETRTGDGVIGIGGKLNDEADEIEALNTSQIRASVLRSQVTETLIPLTVTLNNINASHVGMYVIVENALFPTSIVGQTYGDPTETFDTERTLQACEGFDFAEFRLEISSFANFKQESIPAGGGTISGIISKTFNGSNFVLVLNSTADVNMDGTRCMPLDINDFTIVWEDAFDSGIAAWTAQNIIGPGQSWGQTDFGNPAPSARMSGFQSGAQNNEDWLITPAVDLSGTANNVMLFETVKRFGGPDLEVFMSTDYMGGNPNTDGTWTPLAVALDTNTGSWTSWTSSGTVDISAADGVNVFIAFKYTSNSADGAATFQLDNFKILGL